MSSRQPTHFLSLPRKKVSKERGTRRWRSACGRLLCGARCLGPRAELATFTSFTALKQMRQVRSGGALRALARSPPLLGAAESLRRPPARGFANRTQERGRPIEVSINARRRRGSGSLTFDMSGGRKQAKLAGRRPLDGMVRPHRRTCSVPRLRTRVATLAGRRHAYGLVDKCVPKGGRRRGRDTR